MTTYAQLLIDIPLWTDRTDVAAKVPSYVALFEAWASRTLRVRQMETAFTGTINASNEIALPSDFVAFKSLWISGQEGAPIRPQSLDAVVARDRTSGDPTIYAVKNGAVRFDGSGDVVGVYYADIPAIETAGSNWLSVLAYDAYLFGTLGEAQMQLGDGQAQASLQRAAAVISSLQGNDQRDKFTGPLVAQKR